MTVLNRIKCSGSFLISFVGSVLLWLLICLALQPIQSSAQGVQQDISGSDSPVAESLDLHSALETALTSNPSIRQVHSARERARAGVTSAISAFLPKIDVDFSLGRSNNPVFAFGSKLNQAQFTMQDFQLDRLNDPDYRTNWNTRFRLTQPIFNKGREYVGYRIAAAGESMAEQQERAAAQGVLFSVEQAYFRVLLAKEAMAVMDSAVRAAKEHERLAGKRYEAGLVLKSDVLSATVHRTDMERQRLDARNQFMMAMAALNRAMGVSQDNIWQLEHVDLSASVDSDQIRWWIETAEAHRPDLNLSRRKVDVADYKKQGAQLNFLPSVNFTGMYEQNTESLDRFGGDSWTFMATASFNIFNGLGDRAGLMAAFAEKRAAEEELRDTSARIELEVRQAFYTYQTALKQLEVTKAAVEQAGESVRILKNRYDNGMALMVELLAADTMLKDQKLQQAMARFDALLAMARLELSAGVLGAGVKPSEGRDAASATGNQAGKR